MKKIFLLACWCVAILLSVKQSSPALSATSVYGVRDTAYHSDSSQIFTYAERMPEFPGGQAAFMGYLQKSIKYPQMDRDSSISGTVYIRFVVERDGAVTNVAVRKGVNPCYGLNDEAVRVFRNMPAWSPGEMNGHPVRVEMIQPVRFSLK